MLIQLRIGGQAARLSDESLPLRFGTIGQETTGAGGLAKALRTVPVVLELAEIARRRAAPDAWIVDFTNPVGIVTQALLDQGHRALGLCNVAITLQRAIARRLGVDPEGIALDHVGLNHLSWVTAAVEDGRDRLPELLEAHGDSIATELKLPLALIRELGSVPSYYLRYYYAFDEVMAEQRAGYRRAEEVMELERRLLAMYADPTLDTKPDLLNDRGGAWYSEAAARLLASLHDGRGDVQVVDVVNGDAVPDLAPDDVVEVPARIDRDGAHPIAQGPMSPADARPRARGEGIRAPRDSGSAERRTRRRACRARGASPGREAHRRRRPAARRPPRGESGVSAALRPRAVTDRPTSRMRREIGQIPATVRRALAANDERLPVVEAIRAARPGWVMIAGRGTSDHAGVYAQYLIETQLGLPTGLVKPSVTTFYGASLDWSGGMVLAISQSGRSPDIVAVVEAARSSGALTVAITNEGRSPLAAAAEMELRCHAGPELAVPATKTYVAELAVVAALVARSQPCRHARQWPRYPARDAARRAVSVRGLARRRRQVSGRGARRG